MSQPGAAAEDAAINLRGTLQAHIDQRDIARVQQVRLKGTSSKLCGATMLWCNQVSGAPRWQPSSIANHRLLVLQTWGEHHSSNRLELLSASVCTMNSAVDVPLRCLSAAPRVCCSCPAAVRAVSQCHSSLPCRPHKPQAAAAAAACWPAGHPAVHQAPVSCATSRGSAQAWLHGGGTGNIGTLLLSTLRLCNSCGVAYSLPAAALPAASRCCVERWLLCLLLQTGYLSMDQARSLLPMEATDANVSASHHQH
jgi:hypothetical protein